MAMRDIRIKKLEREYKEGSGLNADALEEAFDR